MIWKIQCHRCPRNSCARVEYSTAASNFSLPTMDVIASTRSRAAEPDRTATSTNADKGLRGEIWCQCWGRGKVTHVSHPATWKSCGMTAMDGPVSPETMRATPPINFMLPGMDGHRQHIESCAEAEECARDKRSVTHSTDHDRKWTLVS
jgi:hypothetical protein